jgi:hypothetical protein
MSVAVWTSFQQIGLECLPCTTVPGGRQREEQELISNPRGIVIQNLAQVVVYKFPVVAPAPRSYADSSGCTDSSDGWADSRWLYRLQSCAYCRRLADGLPGDVQCWWNCCAGECRPTRRLSKAAPGRLR